MEITPQTPLAVRPLPLAKTPREAWAVAPGTNLMILDGVVQELSLLLCRPSSPPVRCLVAGPLPPQEEGNPGDRGGPSLVFSLGLWSLPSSLPHGLDGGGIRLLKASWLSA